MKAFPHKVMSSQQGQGMDLRDYFASHSNLDYMDLYHLKDIDTDDLTMEQRIMALAILKYQYADAMMKAREQ